MEMKWYFLAVMRKCEEIGLKVRERLRNGYGRLEKGRLEDRRLEEGRLEDGRLEDGRIEE